jgi:hypothetical protein
MQALVSRISGLASGVMNINVCCAPEAHRDEQLPHYTVNNTNESMLVRNHRAPSDADGSDGARNRYGSSKPPQAGVHGLNRQVPPNIAGKYSGFLHRAAERGDETMLLAALKIDSSLIEGQDPKGNRALHLAAMRGHAKICQILCQVQRPNPPWIT